MWRCHFPKGSVPHPGGSAETQHELKNCAKGPQKSSILEPSAKDLGKLFPATFPLLLQLEL